MTAFSLALILVAAVANYAFALAILRELSAAGRNTSFFDLRWFIFKNLATYRQLSRARHGRVGAAYYGYLGSFVVLIFALALLLASLR